MIADIGAAIGSAVIVYLVYRTPHKLWYNYTPLLLPALWIIDWIRQAP